MYVDGPLLSSDIHGAVAITLERDQSLGGIDVTVREDVVTVT